jgi:hypothetical protein
VKPEVKVGAVFRCRLPSHVIETAEVIEVSPDALGIQHVKYNLIVAGGTISSFAEMRTLGLETFASRYNEPVPA